MIKQDILARKNFSNVQREILEAKDEFNYLVVLPKVCRMSKVQG